MSSAFITEVARIAAVLKDGVEDIAPEIGIDTSGSSAVSGAEYNVVAQELAIQFRNRRRKLYIYPMNPIRAAEFAMAGSKGSWLKGRAFSVRGRNPSTGRFGINPARNR